MEYDKDKIIKSITVALKDFDMQPDVINDAAFHMTDWLNDLDAWHSFCKKPDSLSSDELQDLLMGFLIHVPSHVAAAGKLVTGFPVKDIFNVGATVENDDDDTL